MERLRNQRILALTVLLIVIGLAGLEAQAGVIWGYVQDRAGNRLNGAIMDYWRQQCSCFPNACGVSSRLVDYTGPSPYGHAPGQFYTVSAPPGHYNVKVTYNGVGYDNALTNIPITTCDNGNVQGPFTITLPIGGSPGCPYSSLQARVQASESSPWAASTTIQRGQRVHVAAFHDSSGQLTTCCTSMQFSGPGLNTAVSNLQYVTPPQTGTYTLRVTCDTRTDTANVIVTDSGACSYSSVRARAQKDGSGWDTYTEINFGDRIRLGAFDGSGQATGCCTTLRFSGPDGMDGADRINTTVSNQQWFTPSMVGVYRLDVACGRQTDSAVVVVLPNYRFGLNTNDLTDDTTVAETVKHFQRLGAGLARVEILNSKPPEFWSRVVDQFNDRGIAVLAALTNRAWTGGAFDPARDACAPGDRRLPSGFGTSLVTGFIPTADPYVQRLKDRVSFWELWNEATARDTYLCPENYAYLLVEAKLHWPDLQNIGISLDSLGDGTASATYLFELAYQTDKSIWWSDNHGGGLPWDITMLHAYPGGRTPEDFIPFQTFSSYYFVPWIPLWITEIGWYGDGPREGEQASMLGRAYNIALSNDDIGAMFWFSLYNCAQQYGLIDNCTTTGRRRQAYSQYINRASGGRLR